MSPVDRQGGEAQHPAGEPGSKSREDFDNLVSRAAEARARGESHVPIAEGGEARNHEAEVEAAVRAEAERLGYRPGEFIDDHMAIARAALDAVRCAQGRDTDAPESDVDRLANDLAGDWRERAERAEADVTMWKTRLVNETARLRELLRAARSPQDEDHETGRELHSAFCTVCGGAGGGSTIVCPACGGTGRAPSPERDTDAPCARENCFVPDTACVMGFDVESCPHRSPQGEDHEAAWRVVASMSSDAYAVLKPVICALGGQIESAGVGGWLGGATEQSEPSSLGELLDGGTK